MRLQLHQLPTPVFHTGNLTFGTGLTLANGVLTAAAASNTTRFSPISATASGSAGQQITIPVGLTVTDMVVFISGVHQQPTADYTISGTTLTILDAYPAGERIYIRPQLGQKGDPGNAGPFTAGAGILISNGTVISVDPASMGSIYTAGTGIAISGSTLSIDTAKVARKDVAQTFASGQVFSDIRTNNIQSPDETLNVYSSYVNISANYLDLLSEGSVNISGDVYLNGSDIYDVFDRREAYVSTLNASSANAQAYVVSGVVQCAVATTITVVADSSFFRATGTQYNFIQTGTGAVTFVPASGVTIQSLNNNRKIAGQFGMATLIKLEANKWALVGALAA